MSSYRDEMSAALARAQAAEKRNELLERESADKQRQVEEQREQLEQQQAEIADLRRRAGIKEAAAEAEKQARSKPRSEAPRSRGKLGRLLTEHKSTVITILVSGLVVGGPLLGMFINDLRAPYSSPGELEQAHLVRSSAGRPALLFVTEVEHHTEFIQGSSYRLDLVDPTSGQRTQRVVLDRADDRPEVLPAAAGRIWVQLGDPKRLEVRSVPSLDLVGSWEAIQRLNKGLSEGFSRSVEVDGQRGGAIVTTKQGKVLLIDSKSLRGSPFAPDKQKLRYDSKYLLRAAVAEALGSNPAELNEYSLSAGQRAALARLSPIRSMGQSQHGTTSSAKLPDKTVYSFAAVGGSPRQVLHRRGPESHRATPVPGADTLLKPELISSYGSRDRDIILPKGAGFVVRHQRTLDSGQGLLFSRVGLDGKKAWTIKGTEGHVKMGYLTGDLVVLAVEGSRDYKSYALGIRWSTGEVVWTYEL